MGFFILQVCAENSTFKLKTTFYYDNNNDDSFDDGVNCDDVC